MVNTPPMQSTKLQNMSEKDLFITYGKTKDVELRNTIVQKYVPLLKSIVNKMQPLIPPVIEVDDAFGYGALGLIDAIDKYNPEQSFQFTTYATYRIRGAIIDGIRSCDYASRSIREQSRKMKEIRAALEIRLGHVATQKELACAMGLNDTKFQQMRTNIARTTIVLCTDTVRERDEGEILSAIDLVRAPTYFEPTAFIDIEVNKEIARHLMRHLSYRERTLCIMYFYRGMTCKGIGKALGLSESRISQLLKRLQNKIKTVYARRFE